MEGVPGLPHEALFLALAHLPLHQLLTMSQVSKSLRDAIINDVLVWLDLVVEKPLNLRITDDILLRLTSNAHGRLRTLALLSCLKITDDCLVTVIHENRSISKLYVPGCTGLTPGTVSEVAKTLPELKQVKIDGIYNINQEHLQELQYHIPQTTYRNPRFYHKYPNSTLRALNEDNSTIDVDICPKCKEVKLVFDCTREACRQCLGCDRCIPRCAGCGICISNDDNDEEIGETLCNDNLCLNCWVRLPKCSHCNKSFCPRHLDEQLTPVEIDAGFVCEVCEMKQTEYV